MSTTFLVQATNFLTVALRAAGWELISVPQFEGTFRMDARKFLTHYYNSGRVKISILLSSSLGTTCLALSAFDISPSFLEEEQQILGQSDFFEYAGIRLGAHVGDPEEQLKSNDAYIVKSARSVKALLDLYDELALATGNIQLFRPLPIRKAN